MDGPAKGILWFFILVCENDSGKPLKNRTRGNENTVFLRALHI